MTLDFYDAGAPKPKAKRAETPRAAPDDSRPRKYALAALAKEVAELATTPAGERNTRLNAAAFSLGQLVGAGALSESEVSEALFAAAKRCGLADDEIRKTLASGLAAGMAQPRDIPEPTQSPKQSRSTKSGSGGPAVTTKPEIDVSADYLEIADAMIAAIAPLDVYQRGGQLVDHVTELGVGADGVTRDGTPRLRLLPASRLLEIADQAASFWKRTNDGRKRVRPSTTLVSIVAARGQWRQIRPLTGVVTYPVLRADGSVLTSSGYDSATGLLAVVPAGLRMPARPSRDDAVAALARLSDLTSEFPFEHDAARAAWLAGLLTPLARHAIDGPVPLLLLDANARGAGKTLLADLIGAIVLGRLLPRRPAPTEEDEWRKAMLAIAIAADPVILIDNVTRTLRSAALDAVLTGTSFRDRLLGKNEELALEVRTLFVATSNNCAVSTDLVRRSLLCRLVAQQETPERRTGFRRQLPGDAIALRPALLSDAATVLAAYVAAGRPAVEMRPMGSFEAWSRVVRAALVWAGQPDPAVTQDTLAEGSDLDRSELGAVLAAWRDVYADRAVTTADILADYRDMDDKSPKLVAFRTALEGWLDKVTARRLGSRLRSAREQIVGGLRLTAAGKAHSGFATWRVVA